MWCMFLSKQYILQQTVCNQQDVNSIQYLKLCGLCLPPEEEEVQYGNQDLLSSRKMSVSRMHSLPNDSYMFQPVRPASAPYPLEEVDISPHDQHSGNLSVQGLTIRHEIRICLLTWSFGALSFLCIKWPLTIF